MNVIEPLIKVISERVALGKTRENIRQEVLAAGYTEEEFQIACAQVEVSPRITTQASPVVAASQEHDGQGTGRLDTEQTPKINMVLVAAFMFLLIGVAGIAGLFHVDESEPYLTDDNEIYFDDYYDESYDYDEGMDVLADETELMYYTNENNGVTFPYPDSLMVDEAAPAYSNAISAMPDKLVDVDTGFSYVNIYDKPVAMMSLRTQVELIRVRMVGDHIVTMYYETAIGSDQPITIGIGWSLQNDAFVDNLAYIFFTPANLPDELSGLPEEVFYQLELSGAYAEIVSSGPIVNELPETGEAIQNVPTSPTLVTPAVPVAPVTIDGVSCAITASKSIYTINEPITIVWVSKGATKASWGGYAGSDKVVFPPSAPTLQGSQTFMLIQQPDDTYGAGEKTITLMVSGENYANAFCETSFIVEPLLVY